MPRRVTTPPRRIPPGRSSKTGQQAGSSRDPQPGSSREPRAGPSGVGQRQSRRRSVSEPRRPTRSSSSSSGTDPSFRSPRMNRSRSEQRSNPSRRPRVAATTRALREIARLQLTTNLLIPKLPFARLIREVLMQYSNTDLRITPEALMCIQESAEIYMVQLFEDAYRCTLHRDRVTLMPKDMNLALYLRERWIR